MAINIRPSKGMFNDPEVGTEAHDAIVRWLAKPDNALALARAFGAADKATATMEHAITTGRNNFLLGFADLVISASVNVAVDLGLGRQGQHKKFWGLLVEVKTGAINTGELLRQINAYKPHVSYTVALVHVQSLEADIKEALEGQGVRCFQIKKLDAGGYDLGLEKPIDPQLVEMAWDLFASQLHTCPKVSVTGRVITFTFERENVFFFAKHYHEHLVRALVNDVGSGFEMVLQGPSEMLFKKIAPPDFDPDPNIRKSSPTNSTKVPF